MSIARTALRASFALARWVRAAAGSSRLNEADAIFVFHGTPRRIAAQLERQLRYLRRRYRIVPLASLLSAGRAGAPTPCAAITFDDGLRNNVRVAYPILQKWGVPATFFVCPGLIEEGKWIWTNESRQRLATAGRGLRAELAAEFGAPEEIDSFVTWMKTLGLSHRKRVEARLREATRRYVPGEAEREWYDLARWDELRRLDPAIVTIGSHTMTHPMLVKLSEQELENELGTSRRLIESTLDRPADVLAYPDGMPDKAALACTRRHYTIAMTCSDEPLPLLPDYDRHLLPRYSPPPGLVRLIWALNRPLKPARQAAQTKRTRYQMRSRNIA